MTQLINRETGCEATEEEYRACMRRAEAILDNPYSSPESIEWALAFPGMEFRFWESCQQRGIRKRRQHGED